MIKTIRTCLSLLALSAGVNAAEDQPRTDINPGLLYYQCFLVAPDLASADREFLFATEWAGKKLPDRFGQLTAKYDNQFKLVRQAAQAKVPCDWGIDMTPGPGTLLAHLARCKGVAQAARLRAMWDLQNGQPADAKADLLAALALARNASRDGTLISDLVQIAIEQILCATIAENYYRLPTETLKQFVDGVQRAPARGTMAASMQSEKQFFYDWMVNKIATAQRENPGDDSKVMAEVREVFSTIESGGEGETKQAPTDHWGQLMKASGGTSAGVIKLLRDQEPLYSKAATILALPRAEYEEQIGAFQAQVTQNENPFVSLTFPAITRARAKEFAAQAAMAMVQAAVEYRLHGEAGLSAVPDPVGDGPFAFERFVLDGVDRGFSLRSSYSGRGFQEELIFVEKEGPAFRVSGKYAGEPIPAPTPAK